MDDWTPPAPPTDADLLARCLTGRREAFQQLAERYYRPICGFLCKRVQQPDLVEDLAQETFLEAYRSLKAGSRPVHFSSWLFGIAVNRCGKWLRRKKPTLLPAEELPDPGVAPDHLLEELEEQTRQQARLDTCLASLSLEARDLVEQKHRQGLTCEQIARRLGQPVGTIKSQLSRAYKALRACLSRDGEELP